MKEVRHVCITMEFGEVVEIAKNVLVKVQGSDRRGTVRLVIRVPEDKWLEKLREEKFDESISGTLSWRMRESRLQPRGKVQELQGEDLREMSEDLRSAQSGAILPRVPKEPR